MEVASMGEGVTKEMELSMKEKIFFAKKNYSDYYQMAEYIKIRLQSEFEGTWGVFIFESGKGNGIITYVGNCFYALKYEDTLFLVFKTQSAIKKSKRNY